MWPWVSAQRNKNSLESGMGLNLRALFISKCYASSSFRIVLYVNETSCHRSPVLEVTCIEDFGIITCSFLRMIIFPFDGSCFPLIYPLLFFLMFYSVNGANNAFFIASYYNCTILLMTSISLPWIIAPWFCILAIITTVTGSCLVIHRTEHIQAVLVWLVLGQQPKL